MYNHHLVTHSLSIYRSSGFIHTLSPETPPLALYILGQDKRIHATHSLQAGIVLKSPPAHLRGGLWACLYYRLLLCSFNPRT